MKLLCPLPDDESLDAATVARKIVLLWHVCTVFDELNVDQTPNKMIITTPVPSASLPTAGGLVLLRLEEGWVPAPERDPRGYTRGAVLLFCRLKPPAVHAFSITSVTLA